MKESVKELEGGGYLVTKAEVIPPTQVFKVDAKNVLIFGEQTTSMDQFIVSLNGFFDTKSAILEDAVCIRGNRQTLKKLADLGYLVYDSIIVEDGSIALDTYSILSGGVGKTTIETKPKTMSERTRAVAYTGILVLNRGKTTKAEDIKAEDVALKLQELLLEYEKKYDTVMFPVLNKTGSYIKDWSQCQAYALTIYKTIRLALEGHQHLIKYISKDVKGVHSLPSDAFLAETMDMLERSPDDDKVKLVKLAESIMKGDVPDYIRSINTKTPSLKDCETVANWIRLRREEYKKFESYSKENIELLYDLIFWVSEKDRMIRIFKDGFLTFAPPTMLKLLSSEIPDRGEILKLTEELEEYCIEKIRLESSLAQSKSRELVAINNLSANNGSDQLIAKRELNIPKQFWEVFKSLNSNDVKRITYYANQKKERISNDNCGEILKNLSVEAVKEAAKYVKTNDNTSNKRVSTNNDDYNSGSDSGQKVSTGTEKSIFEQAYNKSAGTRTKNLYFSAGGNSVESVRAIDTGSDPIFATNEPIKKISNSNIGKIISLGITDQPIEKTQSFYFAAPDGFEISNHLDIKVSQWVLDSGSGSPTVNDESVFESIEDCDIIAEVPGSKNEVHVTKRGRVLLTVIEGEKYYLDKVLYIPDTPNLLPIGRYTGKKHEHFEPKIWYEETYFKIRPHNVYLHLEYDDDTGHWTLFPQVQSKPIVHLNFVGTDSIEKRKEYIERLHSSNGHPSYKTLFDVIKKGMYNNVDSSVLNGLQPSDFECQICDKAKLTKAATIKVSDENAEQIGEIIHADIVGQMPTGLQKELFMVTFIDAFTNFFWVIPVKAKSEALQNLEYLVQVIETQFDVKVKNLRTDGGGEFIGDAFEEYIRNKGIIHQLTQRYTPEQNGKIERQHRTLLERVRALKFQSGAPDCFWPEMVKFAAYCMNITKVQDHMQGLKTPFEIAFRKKPELLLNPFGCDVMVHTPHEEMARSRNEEPGSNKLKPRGEPGIYLGPALNKKASRIYRLNFDDIVESKDVKFYSTFNNMQEFIRLEENRTRFVFSDVFGVDSIEALEVSRILPTRYHDLTFRYDSHMSVPESNLTADASVSVQPSEEEEENRIFATENESSTQNSENNGQTAQESVGDSAEPVTLVVSNYEEERHSDVESDDEAFESADEYQSDDENDGVDVDAEDDDINTRTGIVARQEENEEFVADQGENNVSVADQEENNDSAADQEESMVNQEECAANEDESTVDQEEPITNQDESSHDSEDVTSHPRETVADTIPDSAIINTPPEVVFTPPLNLRRSTRTAAQPEQRERYRKKQQDPYYEDTSLLMVSIVTKDNLVIPVNIKDIENMNDKDLQEKWINAINDEIDSLQLQETWTLVDLPEGKKLIGTRWVFTVKTNSEGEVTKFKARLVAQGFTQIYGIDHFETYAPVAGYNEIRVMLALAAANDMMVHQMDIKTAFLNSTLDEEVYIKSPPGFEFLAGDKVMKLQKGLYGLKQAPLKWFETLTDYLQEVGYETNCMNKNIVVRGSGFSKTFILIYVDDLLIMSQDIKSIEEAKKLILARFVATDIGPIDKFLGLKVTQDLTKGTIGINAEEYINKVIARFELQDILPRPQPMMAGFVLNSTKSRLLNTAEITEYRQLLGSVRYIATTVRADIVNATRRLSHYMQAPRFDHLMALRYLVGYLKETRKFQLTYDKNHWKGLELYSDASYKVGDEDNHSVTGFVLMLCGGPIMWSSKRQTVLSASTKDAELLALHTSAWMTRYVRDLMEELGFREKHPTVAYEDNNGLLARLNRKNEAYGASHDLSYRFDTLKSFLDHGYINPTYIKTDDQLADTFTKTLTGSKYQGLIQKLNIISPPMAHKKRSVEV